MKIYAFDVDDTLEVSGGPISILSVGSLKPQGHIVGLNGNWAVVVQTVPLWHRIFSFIGPMEMSKDIFLNQLKTYIRADDYIMVGNIKGVSGASDDEGAANLAGWRFIKESDFAAGARPYAITLFLVFHSVHESPETVSLLVLYRQTALTSFLSRSKNYHKPER